MKIAHYSESPPDQAALAVVTEGVLGEPPEPVDVDLQAHGFGGLLKSLGAVFRGLYYHSDADALVIVLDSDDTALHDRSHDDLPAGGENCRLCEARAIIKLAKKRMKSMPARADLKVAIGLAVPAIEAWYLAGRDHQVGESACLQHGRSVYTRHKLKQLVYGSDRAAQEMMTECAVREARRIIANLKCIEDAFPAGFGSMAQEMRTWIQRKPT